MLTLHTKFYRLNFQTVKLSLNSKLNLNGCHVPNNNKNKDKRIKFVPHIRFVRLVSVLVKIKHLSKFSYKHIGKYCIRHEIFNESY